MTTLNINYEILAGNCDGLDDDAIEQFAADLRAALAARIPEAEIDVTVRPNTSGLGGFKIFETDGQYEANPEDCEWDHEAVELVATSVMEQVYETAGAR